MDTLNQSQIAAGPLLHSVQSRSIRAFEWDRACTLFLSDLSMLGIASCLAVLCISSVSNSLNYAHVTETALIWTVASICTFKLLGLYRISYALYARDEWYYVIVGLLFGGAPALLVFTVIPALSSSRLVLLLSIVFSALLVGLSRQLIHFRYFTHTRLHKRKVAVVASASDIPQVASAMEGASSQLSFVPVSSTEEAINEVLSGTPFSWYDRLLVQGCDEIVFAGMPTGRTALLVEHAARDRVAIGFAPAGLSLQPCRLDFVTSLRQPRAIHIIAY